MSNFSPAGGGPFDIPDATTPPEITDEIMKLCRQLDPTQVPVYVPVSPWGSSMMDRCFFNLPEKIGVDGGSIQHGWTIWERPGLLIEGEFHAVWVSPEGDLIDITPKKDGETEILFLPDGKRIWTGELIDNVRMPLVDNEITRRLIKSSKESFETRRRHYRGRTSGRNIGRDRTFTRILSRALRAVRRKLHARESRPPQSRQERALPLR